VVVNQTAEGCVDLGNDPQSPADIDPLEAEFIAGHDGP
jgi:hypothetical protein